MKKSKNRQTVKSIFLGILISITLLLIFSCTSTKLDDETNLKNDDQTNVQDDFSDNETWHSVNSIHELTGKWITPEGTIEFPLEIDGKEYLSVTYGQQKDSMLWKNFSKKANKSIRELWENRFVYIPQIYEANYPISDENGTQFGIKVNLDCYINSTSAIITSYKQLLIPYEIVNKNLPFFFLSEDNSKIKVEGIFRFYSKTFMNLNNSLALTVDSTYENNNYGLVLSGGGGKGAYEVGVWKALNEYGIAQKVQAVSGTSVGGLNSAIFAVEPYESIENIWLTKVPDKLTQDDALISQEGLNEIIDTIALKDVQNKAFPQVYVTAVRNKFLLAKLLKSKPGQYAYRFNLNNEKDFKEIQNRLLATSAFPVICSPIKLADGYEYSDGGNESVGGDNTPIDPIVQNHPEINKIIIVYLAHEPKRKIKEIDYDTKKLIHIIPSIELGGILQGTTNFTSNRIKLLIQYGYEDTVKILEQNNYYPVSKYWYE